MLRLIIPLIALAGIAWSVDATLRPYIDVAMAIVWIIVMFTLGDRVETRLAAWEAKPHWRRMKAPAGKRRQRSRTPHHWNRPYSGKSIPLLER